MNYDIETKLKKYKTGYVNGECRSNTYEAQIKRKKRLNMKLDLAHGIFNELPFDFTITQKTNVEYLIRTFPNFKELHSKASNEEIILSFIFYIKSLETNKNTDFTDTKINNLIQKITENKEDLFPQTYEIIHWKITLHFIQKQPILPTQPKNINHNILYKG